MSLAGAILSKSVAFLIAAKGRFQVLGHTLQNQIRFYNPGLCPKALQHQHLINQW